MLRRAVAPLRDPRMSVAPVLALEDVPTREICHRMRLSEGALRRLPQRARERLRKDPVLLELRDSRGRD